MTNVMIMMLLLLVMMMMMMTILINLKEVNKLFITSMLQHLNCLRSKNRELGNEDLVIIRKAGVRVEACVVMNEDLVLLQQVKRIGETHEVAAGMSGDAKLLQVMQAALSVLREGCL